MSEDGGSVDASDEDSGDFGDESSDEEAVDTRSDRDREPRADENYCSSCGEIIKKEAEICPECGVRQAPAGGDSGVDRTTAALLALLLGGLGAHKFYMGKTKQGLLYICFIWTLIPAIVGFIEGIIYLTKSDQEFQQQYVN